MGAALPRTDSYGTPYCRGREANKTRRADRDRIRGLKYLKLERSSALKDQSIGDAYAWFIGGLCAVGLPLAAGALEYTITRVDDGAGITSDPVISETGLIAYTCTLKGEGSARSDVYVYINGEKHNLTGKHPDERAENIKPVVISNTVAWTSTFTSPRTGRDSWVMKEVENQNNPYEELNAGDDARGAQPAQQDPGSFEPANGSAQIASLSTTENAASARRVYRHPSGINEVCLWTGSGAFDRISFDSRNDLGVNIGGDNLLAWQKAKGFPFGWEIMVWQSGERFQITTNYYYDMSPQVHGSLVVWYGWDGEDYEIYLYDHDDRVITQVTSNRYDDVSPQVWADTIVWEGYPAVEADVYTWNRRDGQIRKLSENVEDDINPRIWNQVVAWQGFDGDDFEIWAYDLTTSTRTKLTRNGYDDVQPEIRDGLIVWMGYFENWDAEIFLADAKGALQTGEPVQLTNNEFEDRDPKTAGGRVVWQTDELDSVPIYLASPIP
jgi:hypothetical protein